MNQPLLVQALNRQPVVRPPMWFMRQAGRYLPEYRKVREKFPDFMEFCLHSDAATEVTIQPINRFGLDAAIIFADILTIPHAMGHPVSFSEGHGPHVTPVTTTANITRLANHLESLTTTLRPVANTIRQTRMALPPEKAVIGFCGGPFTLACYMLDTKPSQGIPNTLAMAGEHPRSFTRLLDTLTLACVEYLAMQIAAGANAVQVFDSWASLAPAEMWKSWVQTPLVSIGRLLKQRHPQTPLILFPRLATNQQLLALRQTATASFEAISLSTETDLAWASQTLQPYLAIQGNLDPMLFALPNETAVVEATHKALAVAALQPGYVVNLGHGFTPQTNPDYVARVADIVRAYNNQR